MTTPTPMTTETLSQTVIASPIGPLTIVASDRGVRAILFPDERTGRVQLPDGVVDDAEHPVVRAAATQLGEWFAGERQVFDLPLDPSGSPFQQRVWEALLQIDFGETATYAEVAEAAAGDRGRARAVGAAIGRNPLTIVVPCHRVIGSDGSLTGFAGGLDMKRRLLDHEAGTVSLPFA